MQRIFSTLIVVALMLPAGTPRADEAGPPAWLDELVEVSGITFQVQQIPALVQSSFTRAETEWGNVSPEARASMALAVNWAFSADRMLADVRHHLSGALTDAQAEAALDWLTSPTGLLLTRKEEEASTPAAQKVIMEEGRAMVEDTDRVALMTQLHQAVDASRHQAEVIFQVQRAMLIGLQPQQTAAVRQMELQFEQNRSMIEAMMEDQILSIFLYTYREVSEEVLREYIAFLTSDAGRAYHEAAMEGLTEALRRAGTRMGERIAQMAAEAAAVLPP